MAASTSTAFELPPINIKVMDITLIGDTPLIVHRWSEKQKKAMLDKQMKKAKQAKEAKDPEQDFRESLYVIGADRYGFPTIGFKAAAVTACTSIGGVTKIAARQAFHVEGQFAEINGSAPEMREDMVRVGMGTADIRYRGQFFPWWTVLTVKFNANVLSAEQVLNLFQTAGFAVGVGEWRPEKDGQYGRFHVANAAEMREVIKIKEAA